MSKKVILISSGEKIFAVPTDICEQYALDGAQLSEAKVFLQSEEESDVEGQCRDDSISRNPFLNSSSSVIEWCEVPDSHEYSWKKAIWE